MNAIKFMLRNDSITIPELPRIMTRPELFLSQNSMSSTSNSNRTRGMFTELIFFLIKKKKIASLARINFFFNIQVGDELH
jgi:hypothetical protein